VKATLTPKQEAFCLAYMETSNASEAYRRSYSAENMSDPVIHNKASALLGKGYVRVRLDELRKPAAKKAQMTLESHLTRLDELSRKAEDDGQYSAAINAEVARGKASGIHVEKSERVLTGPNGEPIQTVTRIELVSLSDDCED
jgi:phage terminase small subunit